MIKYRTFFGTSTLCASLFFASLATTASFSTPAMAAAKPITISATNPKAAAASALSPYTLTQEQITVLETGTPVLDIWEGAKNRRVVEVFGAIDIDAPAVQVWKIMKNCDTQLQIVSNMIKCKIKKEDIAAGWDERVQVLNIGRFLPRVKSKFRSEYTPYREIKISRTGGDLSILDGLWNLTTTHDGQTRVTYRARLKPKLPVPRRLMQKATREDMPKVLKNLRDLAESFNQTSSHVQINPTLNVTLSHTESMP